MAASGFAFFKLLSSLWAPFSHMLSIKEVLDIAKGFGNRSPKASDTPATTAAAAAAAEAIRTRASVQARRRYLNLDAIRWLSAEELAKLTAVLQALADYEKNALFDSLGIEESVPPQAAPKPAPAGQAPAAATAQPQPMESGNLRGREVLKGILKAGDTAEIVALLRATGLLGQPAEPSAFEQGYSRLINGLKQTLTEKGGSWDTGAHEAAAKVVLHRYRVRERTGNGWHTAYESIMGGETAKTWKERIAAAADVTTQRKLHEDYQAWLRTTVLKFRKDNPDPYVHQGIPVPDEAPKEKKVRRLKWIIFYIIGTIIIGASCVKMASDAKKHDPVRQETIQPSK